MIRSLSTTNVGPAPKMELNFGERLNLLTGDNGLGKSFLLDVIWWVLTRKWPAEVNPGLVAGKKALPSFEGEATISFSLDSKTTGVSYTSVFLQKEQQWTGKPGRPHSPGLVLYAMSDGSFALWDPHRNYWRTLDGLDIQDRAPAYVFNPNEVWGGKQEEIGTRVCNGLIQDWAVWQKEGGESFTHLKQTLETLSPSEGEKLVPGHPRRISLDDVRDIPTIRMPYQQDVPVVHAASGIRRIIALAYFLVWAWEEHKQAAKQRGEAVTKQVIFLVDEVESHLHPTWQRRIVPALLSVMDKLNKNTEVQLITATHSPLIMVSVEPLFDSKKDAWFDLDLERDKVELSRREYEKHGNAETWLVSEAFDLKSGRSIEYEVLVGQAAELLKKPQAAPEEISRMHEKLVHALGPKDDFLFRWRAICDKRGLANDSRKPSA